MQSPPLHETVAAEVRAELARRKVNQTQIAMLLGISQAGVSRRLLGQTPMDVNEIAAIAEFLDIPIGTLFPERVA